MKLIGKEIYLDRLIILNFALNCVDIGSARHLSLNLFLGRLLVASKSNDSVVGVSGQLANEFKL